MATAIKIPPNQNAEYGECSCDYRAYYSGEVTTYPVSAPFATVGTSFICKANLRINRASITVQSSPYKFCISVFSKVVEALSGITVPGKENVLGVLLMPFDSNEPKRPFAFFVKSFHANDYNTDGAPNDLTGAEQ